MLLLLRRRLRGQRRLAQWRCGLFLLLSVLLLLAGGVQRKGAIQCVAAACAADDHHRGLFIGMVIRRKLHTRTARSLRVHGVLLRRLRLVLLCRVALRVNGWQRDLLLRGATALLLRGQGDRVSRGAQR